MGIKYNKTISVSDFHAKYKRTGVYKSEVFSGRKALMEEIYATGNPIYCDQSYYVHEKEYNLVVKNGDHFECDRYTTFEEWRDCHYYNDYADAEGNKVWLMTGGRYD